MDFLSGSVSHQLDGKNRIRIPAKFRSKLGNECFFMARPDGCIGVYSKEALDAVIERMNEITTGNPEKLKAKRIVLSSIEEVKEDDTGRILLSPFLRKHAHIVKDIVTNGMGDFLEIWAKETFDSYSEEMPFDDACTVLDF